MIRLKRFLLLLLLFCHFGCKDKRDNPYAIKDFPKKLQPYLLKMVQAGMVTGRDSAFQNIVTDKELVRLGNCEHPILRTAAFRENAKKEINFYYGSS